MPQIIVAADRGAAFGEGTVTFRETVNVADFDSQHFASQLVERIGWAVEDADQVEQLPATPPEIASDREARADAPEPQSDEREERKHDEVRAGADARVSVPSPA